MPIEKLFCSLTVMKFILITANSQQNFIKKFSFENKNIQSSGRRRAGKLLIIVCMKTQKPYSIEKSINIKLDR